MTTQRNTNQQFPVKLTRAQQKVIVELAPELADRLSFEKPAQRTVQFTLPELRAINWLAGDEVRWASTARKRISLRHVTDITAQALDRYLGIEAARGCRRSGRHV